MADPVADIANQLNSSSNNENLPYVQMRFGLVTAINAADNTCTIQLSGDNTLNISGIKSLNIFQPTVNDVVCCLKQGTDVVVIGKFQTSTAQAYGQITNIVSANNVLTSGGFVNLSSTPNSVVVNKRYSTSNLFISLSITGWGDVTSTGFTSGVNISGVGDFITGAINLDLRTDTGGNVQTMTQRVPCVGSQVISGVPAGNVTVTIRIRNHGATGNLHVDTGDFYTLTVQEIL